MLITRELPGLSATDVSRVVRQREEALSRAYGTDVSAGTKRLPVIVLTRTAETEDLKLFMQVCLSRACNQALVCLASQ